MIAPIQPVGAGERVAVVDILRGFALFGILLVNFAGGTGSLVPSVDGAVGTGLDLLVSDSFYPLFSFLFGLGLALQLHRARGAGLAHLSLRRLLVLFLIGTGHALLIWDGDILVWYAMLGLLLIPLQKLSVRAVLLVALFLFGFQFVGPRVQGALGSWRSTPEREQVRELAEGVRQEDFGMQGNLGLLAQENGSWRDNVAYRWDKYSRRMNQYSAPVRVLSEQILFLFVVGLYVGRRRLLEDFRRRRRGFALMATLGALLAIAVPVVLKLFPDAPDEVWTLRDMAVNWGVTAFYVGGITLLVAAGGRAARKLALLAPVGRMGLTNYLMQSIVMTLLFFPYALDLPEFGATVRVLIDCGFFFLVQVPLSHWWLARFHFGPAEWLWRSLTYGYAQPMRRDDAGRQGAPLLAT